MKYINEQGIVIDAVQWDGTGDARQVIENKFGVLMGANFDLFYLQRWITTLEIGDYIFQHPFFGYRLDVLAEERFKNFKPITDARVLMVEELKKEMLIQAQEKQEKGYPDDWRSKELRDLFLDLHEELDELADELEAELQKTNRREGVNFVAARIEAAHAGLVLAFIIDKLNAMELEAMLENKEKDAGS